MNSLEKHLEATCHDIVDRCTGCGDCYRVCPVIPLTDLEPVPAGPVIAGVLNVLRGEYPGREALDWAGYCTRCGLCIDACDAGVNPRKMLALCEGFAHQAEGSVGGGQLFKRMARSIRLLSGLQLTRNQINGVQNPPHARTDVVFYAGCNILQTPHILLNATDLLSLLGVDFQILGGVGYCCGVVHFLGGEVRKANRITTSLYDRLNEFEPNTVLTWCPTCELHLGETTRHGQASGFELAHFTDFLAAHRETLAAQMTIPLHRRVALHEHSGHPHITQNVRSLLDIIPGIDWFSLDDDGQMGYSCNLGGLSRLPEVQARVHRQFRDRAVARGADEIIDVYHGCHRLLADGGDNPAIRNFTDLLLEALGLAGNEDRFQKYRSLPGTDQVFADAEARMAENGLDPEKVRPLLSRILEIT